MPTLGTFVLLASFVAGAYAAAACVAGARRGSTRLIESGIGAFYFVTGIAGLLASLGAGWLWDREGASATFYTSAMLAAVALAMLSLLQSDDRHPVR